MNNLKKEKIWYDDAQIYTRLKNNINFQNSNGLNVLAKKQQIWLQRALKLCSSNLLISKLTGINSGTVSSKRSLVSDAKEARSRGLNKAYNYEIEPLLELADELEVCINHKGYNTEDDFLIRKKHLVPKEVYDATHTIPQEIKPIVAVEEKNKKEKEWHQWSVEAKIIAVKFSPSKAFKILKKQGFPYSQTAIAKQRWKLVNAGLTPEILSKNLNTKTEEEETVVAAKPVLLVKNKADNLPISELEAEIALAKRMGAKSITLKSGNTFSF